MKLDVTQLPAMPNGEIAPEGSRHVTLDERYVDYDTIVVRGNDQIWGNWRSSPDEACSDKAMNRWVDRMWLGESEPVGGCPNGNIRWFNNYPPDNDATSPTRQVYLTFRGSCNDLGQNAHIKNRNRNRSVTVTLEVQMGSNPPHQHTERVPAGGDVNVGCTVSSDKMQKIRYKIVGAEYRSE